MAKVQTWFQSEKDFLAEHLTLNTDTGVIYWKKDNPRGISKAGDPLMTGKKNTPGGARQVTLMLPGKTKRSPFPVIQIAWFLIHGKQSLCRLEPIDGNYENLRPDNIRPMTRKGLLPSNIGNL